jgi:hypothetical protein
MQILGYNSVGKISLVDVKMAVKQSLYRPEE